MLGAIAGDVIGSVYEGVAEILGLEPVAAKDGDHAKAFLIPDERMLEALGADVRLAEVAVKDMSRDISHHLDNSHHSDCLHTHR